MSRKKINYIWCYEKVILYLQIKVILNVRDLKTNGSYIKYLPGNFHDLTGNRKGQWACNLDNPYRLIFVPHENPIPTNSDGQYIWVEIRGVEIIDIENYHGK